MTSARLRESAKYLITVPIVVAFTGGHRDCAGDQSRYACDQHIALRCSRNADEAMSACGTKLTCHPAQRMSADESPNGLGSDTASLSVQGLGSVKRWS